MGSLTEEQRRRVEENRRKAMEKRAASLNARPAGGRNLLPVQVPSNNGAGFGAPQGQRHSVAVPSSGNATAGINTNTANRTKSNPVLPQKALPQPKPSINNTINGKALCGLCVMVARDRFVVEIGFNQQLIAIFRSLTGHKYESEKKRWTFPISKHSDLISAVIELRPAVVINPLPNFILRVFRNASITPRSIPEIDLSSIDVTLVRTLMKFQVDGVRFGISKKGRCLISDDMGLGKSIQGLGVAHYYYDEWPLLIVCPSSMRYAWRDSIWKWLPSVPEGSITVVETGRDDIEHAKVLITSYDMLAKRAQDFMKCGVVIMDESHHLKNPKTARTKAAMPIMRNVDRLILLSGTPALSRPIELYSQISAIDRNLFPSWEDYGVRYCNGKKNTWGWDFTGSSNMEELQLFLEETIMIRRLKSEVLEQLPSKIRKVVVLDPNLVKNNTKELKAKAAAFINGKNLKGMERRGKLLEYYSETAGAKMKAVTAYIKDLVEDGKKFVVFAHHKSLMDAIGDMMETMKTRYIRIDGSTSSEIRNDAVELFQTSDNIPVAILSITAANCGITLTAAKLVVFAELYWNPGILTQAEDRAHRIGQEDSVLVEYLIATGTADDVLWSMVQDKLKVLNKAGLSKEDFSSAAVTQRVTKKKTLDNYFGASQKSVSEDMDVDSGQRDKLQDLEDLESDQQLLDQLLDESIFVDEDDS